ncbi:recombinase family protein [Chloroflexota bacterium]
MFDLALSRKTLFSIQKELEKRSILSPSGNPRLERPTLSGILRNPIYAGRYYALKGQVREPKRRKGTTYGNTSIKHLPLDESVYLDGVEIVNPPINWEQYHQLAEIRKRIRN